MVSPDTARTFSYSHIINHEFEWSKNAQAFTASVTFSNVNYVSDTERRVDETFNFAFPRIRFDPQTKTFHARTSSGETVPVAALGKEPFGDGIKPLPGTRIHIYKKSGRARVVLEADTDASFSRHWVEHRRGFYLQNLLAQYLR